jgi:hypothetical protein
MVILRMSQTGLLVASKIKSFAIAFLSTLSTGCSIHKESTCQYSNHIYSINDNEFSIAIGDIPDIHGDYSITFKGKNFKMAMKLSKVEAKRENGNLILENENFPRSLVVKESDCQAGIFELIMKAKNKIEK